MVWITGLAGAGKTRIASEVVRQLRAESIVCLLLDGDVLRDVIGERRYDRASRLSVAYRISRLAQEVAAQGLVAVVATISLFHEIHAFNRTASTPYFEVWIESALPILRQRSTVYTDSHEAEIVGVGQTAEYPRAAHLVLRNEGSSESIVDLAEHVIAEWKRHVRL